MARKFKIGDKVKIVKDIELGKGNMKHGFRLGRVGIVKDIGFCMNYSYCVQFRNDDSLIQFHARELELVKRKGK